MTVFFPATIKLYFIVGRQKISFLTEATGNEFHLAVAGMLFMETILPIINHHTRQYVSRGILIYLTRFIYFTFIFHCCSENDVCFLLIAQNTITAGCLFYFCECRHLVSVTDSAFLRSGWIKQAPANCCLLHKLMLFKNNPVKVWTPLTGCSVYWHRSQFMS